MLFKKIHIEGFGSIVKKTEFILDRPGIHVICGNIGSGKTTILSALFWCMYGQKLKDKSSINSWEHIIDENYKGTKVTVYLVHNGINFKIVRCENYIGKIGKRKGGKNIFIYADGTLLSTKNKKDIQKDINNIFGYSPELFRNSIIFGQKMKRIIEETGPKKKQIFEEAFDISYLQKAKEKTSEKITKNKEAYYDLENDIDKIKINIDSLTKLIKEKRKSHKELKNERSKRIKELNNDITELKQELSEIKVIKKQNLDELDLKISSHEIYIDEVNDSIKKYQKTIKELKGKLKILKTDKCFECGNPLNKKEVTSKKDKIKSDILKNKKSLDKYKKVDLTQFQNELKEWQKEFKNIERNNELYKTNKKKIKNIRKKITDKKSSLQKIKKLSKDSGIKKLVEEKNSFIRKLKKKKTESRRLKNSLKTLEWLIKDPLSNSGIKAYLLKEMINSVNIVLDSYSATLGFLIKFSIDLQSHNKDFTQSIKLPSGELVNYHDLSGGQRQLVDTSIALAIHEVVSSMKPSNIIFMDEPFESLDIDTVEKIAELIELKPKSKSIFIITHQKTFRPLNSSQISVTQNHKGHTLIN